MRASPSFLSEEFIQLKKFENIELFVPFNFSLMTKKIRVKVVRTINRTQKFIQHAIHSNLTEKRVNNSIFAFIEQLESTE